jgi:hypothetical protein
MAGQHGTVTADGCVHTLAPSTEDNDILLSKTEGKDLTENPRIELPQGTLDLLILKIVALDPLHGWGISERLQQISNNVVKVQQTETQSWRKLAGAVAIVLDMA